MDLWRVPGSTEIKNPEHFNIRLVTSGVTKTPTVPSAFLRRRLGTPSPYLFGRRHIPESHPTRGVEIVRSRRGGSGGGGWEGSYRRKGPRFVAPLSAVREGESPAPSPLSSRPRDRSGLASRAPGLGPAGPGPSRRPRLWSAARDRARPVETSRSWPARPRRRYAERGSNPATAAPYFRGAPPARRAGPCFPRRLTIPVTRPGCFAAGAGGGGGAPV